MDIALTQLDWLGIGVASVAHLLLGGVWYTLLFRDRYARVMGLDEWPAKAPARFIVGPFLCSFVSIMTTAILLRALHISGYEDALVLGSLVGIGYIGATTANIAINPLFPHPYGYAIITVPLFLIGSLMSSLILVAL
ncbi:DUF1761 domain-containing protein [Sphingomonas sp. PP-CC-3G-468]|uniref:DUF1761 domain-containing protein n=1 Tax=Sphingomonas sp. PP-CC-3G-468 TaxID=2135656 RepID=UPI00104C5D5F|nr:DUF1761 domain-containing protein [Sphingomonas sp. PP-CC-3G-468]TCM07421.1 uncharacterized protein DUF1761 [Sphingomonas sp. PP-CC-3G-468]